MALCVDSFMCVTRLIHVLCNSSCIRSTGRAELPRLILHTAGQPFDDCPYEPDLKTNYEPDLMFGQVRSYDGMIPCSDIHVLAA